jgi:hypothetical protein
VIDGVARQGFEEAIRFLTPGSTYECTFNDHDVLIVKLASFGGKNHLVACVSCEMLIEQATVKPFMAVHRHTEPKGKQG